MNRYKYSARNDYQSVDAGLGYEARAFYRGFFGARRRVLEKRAVRCAIRMMDEGSTILDCPCGNGRWMGELSRKAKIVLGRDVSRGMTTVARERARSLSKNTVFDIDTGDAESLCLRADSVDCVFSYALMKHLPAPVQREVLREFARVAKSAVICSFAISGHVSHKVWKVRRLKESYPVTMEELQEMAAASNLEISNLWKASQPLIGLEYLVWLKKK